LADNTQEKKMQFGKIRAVYDTCPHCGQPLSPWQQVLLSVDRALICKECWYRIILDVFDGPLIIEGKPRDRMQNYGPRNQEPK
jgi:hypothetical protein